MGKGAAENERCLRGPGAAREPTEAHIHLLQFNIEVQEVEGAAKALERWRREGPSLPLVLEVRLRPGIVDCADGPRMRYWPSRACFRQQRCLTPRCRCRYAILSAGLSPALGSTDSRTRQG